MRVLVTCLVVLGSVPSVGFAADLTINLPDGVTMDFNYILTTGPNLDRCTGQDLTLR